MAAQEWFSGKIAIKSAPRSISFQRRYFSLGALAFPCQRLRHAAHYTQRAGAHCVNNETTALLNRLPLIIALLKDLHTRDSNNETICARLHPCFANKQTNNEAEPMAMGFMQHTAPRAIGSKRQTIKMQLYKLHH
jgi:hypothetical protein